MRSDAERLAPDASDFARRQIGWEAGAERALLATLGAPSVDAFVDAVIPAPIRTSRPLSLPPALAEPDALRLAAEIAARNEVWRSYLGMGYAAANTPAVIQRNVLENPGWYTPYTPYQAEVAQGRLEALLAFQQMVIDLTGLPVANASLLDEATAAAEAMALLHRAAKNARQRFFVDAAAHPQVIAVMKTRAKWQAIEVVVGDPRRDLRPEEVFGAHLQYPDTFGRIDDPREAIAAVHAAGGLVSLGVDPLALLVLASPGALGADVAIGSTQRFGIPLGYGGPHAAFMSVRAELTRSMPGRIIGVSKDAAGRPAYRMALQTREQHIRREKATSNICTAQALLACMAAFYAMWHGPAGLRAIAERVHARARLLATAVAPHAKLVHAAYFDTLLLDVGTAQAAVRTRAEAARINLRYDGGTRIAVTLDETVTLDDVADLAHAIGGERVDVARMEATLAPGLAAVPADLRRAEAVLAHPVFNSHHSETAMMRYLKRLENRDISLVHSMIPLGSCTMKLNAAATLAPLAWPGFARLHPFAPAHQARGYSHLVRELGEMLCELTGFAHVSFQPNSGAQGEYAGLLAVRNWHASRGEAHRDVCLIPASAHGTNPASAHMIGMQVVVVACDRHGNVDVADLERKVAEHRDRLAALMITYPSTHGVFEPAVKDVCRIVHAGGGQVYFDGANMNALCALVRPAELGADICHLNLHKTFAIPHGGGGPGMGPIACADHLAPFLPEHPHDARSHDGRAVAAAPYGSASILTISWMYLRMMGAEGLRRATQAAIVNANYVARRVRQHFPVLYTAENGTIGHECILDLRHLRNECGVTCEDVAKRLIDYGFHSPTMSFPVIDTLMVEPTESESKAELDRFCDAMIAIAGEIASVKSGVWTAAASPLRNAPHTAEEIAGDWPHPYTRAQAVHPLPWLKEAKFWPPVKRIDNAAGDRQLVCTCPPVEAYQ